jgi:hypothetical protein
VFKEIESGSAFLGIDSKKREEDGVEELVVVVGPERREFPGNKVNSWAIDIGKVLLKRSIGSPVMKKINHSRTDLKIIFSLRGEEGFSIGDFIEGATERPEVNGGVPVLMKNDLERSMSVSTYGVTAVNLGPHFGGESEVGESNISIGKEKDV